MNTAPRRQGTPHEHANIYKAEALAFYTPEPTCHSANNSDCARSPVQTGRESSGGGDGGHNIVQEPEGGLRQQLLRQSRFLEQAAQLRRRQENTRASEREHCRRM